MDESDRVVTSAPASWRRDLIDLTVALASIDSTNPGLVPGAAGEAEVAAWVARWMRRQGWEVEVAEVVPGRPNVVGRLRGRGGPSLLVNAHLDTVGAIAAARQVRVEGDRIHGRGVLDTKGGLAAALWAAATLTTPPPGDVVLAAVCDEEDRSMGTEALVETVSADASVVLEPTGMAIGVRHRGFAVLEVVARGTSAHTAHREQGRNAIDAMVAMAGRLGDVDRQLGERGGEAVDRATVQLTAIDGGRELFTVPDRCRATVEVRTVSPYEAGDVAAVRSAVRGIGTADEGWIDERVVMARPPLADDHPSALVEAMATALGSAGREVRQVALPFWTDAALQQQAGIPSVVFGPGGHGIHSDDEVLLVDDLVGTAAVLADVMARFGALG